MPDNCEECKEFDSNELLCMALGYSAGSNSGEPCWEWYRERHEDCPYKKNKIKRDMMKKEEKEDLISRKELLGAIRMYLEKSNLGEITARTDLSVGEIASIISDIPSVKNFEKQTFKIENKI